MMRSTMLLLWLFFVGLTRLTISSTVAGSSSNKQDEPFTILFFSDMENRYRGHRPRRCRYIIEYLRDLESENLFFEGDYFDIPVAPKLILHGGDNNHMLSCETDPFCRSSRKDWSQVWSHAYKTNIPMLTGFGNHDWLNRNGTGDTSLDMWGDGNASPTITTNWINRKAQRFVSRTYETSAKVAPELQYQEFDAKGRYGQSFYKILFRGIQIAHLNCALNWESYDGERHQGSNTVYSTDEQFTALTESLDRNMTTIFFQHYPIASLPAPARSKMVDLVQDFSSAVHLSGHWHVPRTRTYTPANLDQQYAFRDHIAPYPHSWPTDCSNCNPPGFYALLVSPTSGLLQIRQMDIPGLQDGQVCDLFDSCKLCHSGYEYFEADGEWKCGKEEVGSTDTFCWSFFSCDECQESHNCPWYGLFLFFCRCT